MASIEDIENQIETLREQIADIDDYNLIMVDWNKVEKMHDELHSLEEQLQFFLVQPSEDKNHLQALIEVYQPPIILIEAIETIQELSVPLLRHLKSQSEDLIKIPPSVFEHLIGELLASSGFEDVRLVGSNRLTSADIFAVHTVNSLGTRIRFFIEVKRTRDRIGIQVINSVIGAMEIERPRFGCHAALIVSLGGFTNLHNYSTHELSFRGIELFGPKEIQRWLHNYEPNGQGLWLPKGGITNEVWQ